LIAAAAIALAAAVGAARAATPAPGAARAAAPAPVAGPMAGPDLASPTPAARPGSRPAATAGLSAESLRRRLASQMRATRGASGALVVDLDARAGGGQIFSWASRTPRILASNMKLFTTSALLERYGAAKTFSTRLWVLGRRSGQSGRVLRGGLGLVGSGDPALADGDFARQSNLPLTRLRPLARAVKAAGIHVLHGGVVADQSVFDPRRTIPQGGVTGGPYLGSLSGLDYDSGYVHGHLASRPARVAGRALVAKLRAEGVRVTGKVRVHRVRASTRRGSPLGAVASPDVGELIADTNRPSNNFFAEMLLKRLAAAGHHRGTTARGVRIVERFARRAGSSVRAQNGSGLSRFDRASPRDVVGLLRSMAGRGDAGVFRSSLPAACKEGTLTGRMCGTAAEGHCRAKTGTLSGVSALSGYCEARHHHLLAFSLLMNNVNIDVAHTHQDRIASLIARYSP
jgi:D-alanyl-D-alanine carboxypeptidase/D-alanyl-D-alanine-endopeptidase (penicillin-binding protein 4)